MEKERAIALLDETLDQYRTVTSDDLEEIGIQLRGDRDNLTALAKAVCMLNIDGEDDEAIEERERIKDELDQQANALEETIVQIEGMIEKLNR